MKIIIIQTLQQIATRADKQAEGNEPFFHYFVAEAIVTLKLHDRVERGENGGYWVHGWNCDYEGYNGYTPHNFYGGLHRPTFKGIITAHWIGNDLYAVWHAYQQGMGKAIEQFHTCKLKGNIPLDWRLHETTMQRVWRIHVSPVSNNNVSCVATAIRHDVEDRFICQREEPSQWSDDNAVILYAERKPQTDIGHYVVTQTYLQSGFIRMMKGTK